MAWLFQRNQPGGIGWLVRPGAFGRNMVCRPGWRNDAWAESPRWPADQCARRRGWLAGLSSRRGAERTAARWPVWLQHSWRDSQPRQFLHSRSQGCDHWRRATSRRFARRSDCQRRASRRRHDERNFSRRRDRQRRCPQHERPRRTTPLMIQAAGAGGNRRGLPPWPGFKLNWAGSNCFAVPVTSCLFALMRAF